MPADTGVLRFVALRPAEGSPAFQAKVMSFDGPSELTAAPKDKPNAGTKTGGTQPKQPKKPRTIDDKAERHLNSSRYFFRKYPGAERVSEKVEDYVKASPNEYSAEDLRAALQTELNGFFGHEVKPGDQDFDNALSTVWTSYWSHALVALEGPTQLGQLVTWLKIFHVLSLSDEAIVGFTAADWASLRPSIRADLFTVHPEPVDGSIQAAQRLNAALAQQATNLKAKIAALEAGERSVRKILRRKLQSAPTTVPPPPAGGVIAPPTITPGQGGPHAQTKPISFGFPDPMILTAADLDAPARALATHGLRAQGAYGPDLLEQIAAELRMAYSQLTSNDPPTEAMGGLSAFTRTRLRWEGQAQ